MSGASPSSRDTERESDLLARRRKKAQLSNITPYSRSRDSNYSGSGWGDAQLAMSDDLEDTLDMLATEMNNRVFPTAASVISEDSPGGSGQHQIP